MFTKFVIVAVIAIVVAQAKHIPETFEHKVEEQHEVHHSPSPYKYEYAVEDEKTGDYKSHQEESDGEIVKGKYTVAHPDGTIMTVKYTVGKHTGYQAVVTTHGEHDHKVEYYGFSPEFNKAVSESELSKHDYSHESASNKNVQVVPRYYHEKKTKNVGESQSLKYDYSHESASDKNVRVVPKYYHKKNIKNEGESKLSKHVHSQEAASNKNVQVVPRYHYHVKEIKNDRE